MLGRPPLTCFVAVLFSIVGAACGSDAGHESWEGTHHVLLHTTQGDIELELYADAAPLTVANFTTHVENGYYDDLIFHRVIEGSMIEGGDPSGTGTGGESVFGGPFIDEVNDLGMNRGVIAMANRGPDTNTSRFFIVLAEEGLPHLTGRHTTFGRVTSGIGALDAIAAVPTDGNDRPLDPQRFTAELAP